MKAAELRDLYDDETVILDGGMAPGLTSERPPVTRNYSERTTKGGRIIYEFDLEEEPADRIGQNLSGEMVTLIGGIRADFVSYSPQHPVRRAMTQWERSCRRRHRPGPSLQWRDHASGPICGEMLWAAARGSSVLWCAINWQIPYPRAERLLLSGLRYVSDQLEQWSEAQLGMVHDRERCSVCSEEG